MIVHLEDSSRYFLHQVKYPQLSLKSTWIFMVIRVKKQVPCLKNLYLQFNVPSCTAANS